MRSNHRFTNFGGPCCCVALLCVLLATGVGMAGTGETHYQYDELGRLVRVELPDGHMIEYVYDAAGNIINVEAIDDTDGDGVADTLDNCPDDPNPSQLLSDLTGRVWLDEDGNGIQDVTEVGFQNTFVVAYDDASELVDLSLTDANGAYAINQVCPGDYSLDFALPSGHSFTARDQGADDNLDSDVEPTTGLVDVPGVAEDEQRSHIDGGLIVGCPGPDEPVYISGMSLTTDGNFYPIVTFQDPNQPAEVTGYNVYRSDDPEVPRINWPLEASNVVDQDEATPNKQWIDQSGDVPGSGVWYYEIAANSSICGAEGP